jgi:hypothetical protein
MTRSIVNKRTISISFFVLAILSLNTLAAQAQMNGAQSPYIRPGRYEIQNAASEKFMELDRSDGTTVWQWEAGHQKNQQWDIEDAGYGYVHIRSAENGLFLDIAGGVARDEARLFLTRPSGSESQLWIIEDAREGLVRISSRLGKCIDVPNASRENGVRWQLWKPVDRYAEKFRLLLLAGPSGPERGDRDLDGEGKGEKGAYHHGYSFGVEDAQAHLRRSYARHKGQYNAEWEEAFIEGYYDGYDNGRTDTAGMQATEKQSYDLGYRFGRQDYEGKKNPNYTRYADRFDARSEPYFRRGYEDGYHSAR